MEISVKEIENNTVIIKLFGDIDIYTSSDLKDAMISQVDFGAKRIIMDMENNKLKSYLSDIQNDINNNKDVIDRNTIKLDTIKRSIIYNTEILNVKSKELDELNEKLMGR